MHSLVRRYLKTAIVFLAIGLAIGLWALVRRELYDRWPEPYVVSAHTHAILVGFVMMMILGVALWLFPRPERGDTRYDPRLASVAYWLLTTGTAARIAGELARVWTAATWIRVIVIAASVAQVAGLGVFFYTVWNRIRAVGSAAREAAGERF